MIDENEHEDASERPTQALIPVEQGTIIFHGKPLIVVRLSDGQFGVVLRWICEKKHGVGKELP